LDFALDHLTVTDTTPSQLVRVAAHAGYRAVCLFMQPMEVLPRMPAFDIYGPTEERRLTKALLDDLGIGLDLAYPFTLSGRTVVETFAPALETAAYLGAKAVNVLAYDREPQRRQEVFAAFCDLALAYGLDVAVEFFPTSQVRTLDAALDLTAAYGAPGKVGVNLDLLHLVRSGAALADICAVPAEALLYAQFCDGGVAGEREGWDFEASSQRLYPGEGTFDLAGFAAALPKAIRASIEIPREDLLVAGVPVDERAARALAATRRAIQPPTVG